MIAESRTALAQETRLAVPREGKRCKPQQLRMRPSRVRPRATPEDPDLSQNGYGKPPGVLSLNGDLSHLSGIGTWRRVVGPTLIQQTHTHTDAKQNRTPLDQNARQDNEHPHASAEMSRSIDAHRVTSNCTIAQHPNTTSKDTSNALAALDRLHAMTTNTSCRCKARLGTRDLPSSRKHSTTS